jgi:hypothetical protein
VGLNRNGTIASANSSNLLGIDPMPELDGRPAGF